MEQHETEEVCNNFFEAITNNDIITFTNIVKIHNTAVLQWTNKTGGAAYGAFPLYFATLYAEFTKDKYMLLLLLKLGADVNQQFDSTGETALINSSYWGHISVVQVLLEHNADPNIRMNSGWTALHSVANAGHFDIAKLLLYHGADSDATLPSGEKPVDLCSTEEKKVLFENLIIECNTHVKPAEFTM